MFKSKKLSALLAFLMIFTIISPALPTLADVNSVTLDAGTGTDGDETGTIAWTNVGGITDSGYAEADVDTNAITHYLKGTNYNFNIPTNADIQGIKVVINHRSSGVKMQDNIVSLIKNGNIEGENKAHNTD